MSLKSRLRNHPSRGELFGILDEVVELLGEHEFIEALCRALSSDELKENLDYIITEYELYDEDEDDEDDDF